MDDRYRIMKITELNYSRTNTYLILGEKGSLLLDTGWAGTFYDFCRCLGEIGIKLTDIDMILISHYHPDHMGIAQEIADNGPVIAVCDIQKSFIHSSDHIFEKENRKDYKPIDDSKIRLFDISEGRRLLDELGISGEIIHTPGHSDDSISLLLDSGELFVGDLNPPYELELHKGTVIGDSWDKLLARKPKVIYYGHAKTFFIPGDADGTESAAETCESGNDTGRRSFGLFRKRTEHNTLSEKQDLVGKIIKLIDKGYGIDHICRKTGADKEFVGDVMRMYLTHPGVSVQGILDRIEIKGR